MTTYPVIFRCSECTIELPSLELLESHIWSRHLHNFPFSCAVCRFPAIAHSSLAAHFKQAHSPGQPVEFQRKMMDELRLRDIIANSIVVPVYEEDVIYEPAPPQDSRDESQQREIAIQSLDTHSREPEAVHTVVPESDEQPVEIIDVGENDENMQITVVSDANPSVAVPLLEQGISMENEMINELDMFVPEGQRFQKVEMFQNVENGPDIAVVEDTGMLDGQHISKSSNDLRMRLAKQRHIDFVVNKVARRTNNGRTRRPLTIYECEECGKIIRYPSKIEEHRRSHNGVKPHQCHHCGQRFSQKGGLTCHLRLHTGERPYHCTWDCGKSFHSNSALKMHERTHNGDRPYSCEICGKLFSKRSHCQRHEQSVHPRETARRAAHQFGLAAAGDDEDRLRDVVNGVIEEVRIERSLRSELKVELD
ncbi:unnamed protein product [Haemonchus placei]|uniref:Zinc finger protein n=1 Tax=Haemonchus placei TaxID=6290 RepID=A0A158QQD0_HAEPC|nr:unnamed protein product [Haemonchus placei]